VKEFGFFMVKMNPAQNRYPIDSPEVIAVADHIVELGAVPVFHYGADTEFTPASGLERIARLHPDHPVVGVHMGGGGAGYLDAEQLYHDSRDLGLRYPNIRFILSAIRDTYIEQAFITYQHAGEPFSRNLFCGSDAPYGRMAWNFGGFRAMLDTLQQQFPAFTPEAATRYLGGNFAQFAVEGCHRILAKHAVSHHPALA
jgi:predicted TIM-barrel fold metal-dependent hydrolase